MNQTITVQRTDLEAITNYAEGVDLDFRAVISDSFTNNTTSTNILNLTIKETILTVDTFELNNATFKIGDTATFSLVFSEAVDQFNSNTDINVDNGTLSLLTSLDQISWTGTFTPNNGVEAINNEITLTNGSYTDTFGNPGVGATSNTYNIDTVAPAAFNISILTVGGNSVANFWNSTNTSLNISIPIAVDNSLVGGQIKLRGRVQGNGFEDIGSVYTIVNGDLGTNKILSVNGSNNGAIKGIEGITNYLEGSILEFTTIISDSFNNPTNSTNNPSLTVKENLPTVNIFTITPNLITAGNTGNVNLHIF